MIEPHPLSVCCPPRFNAAFRRQLEELFRWRRDVRRFRTDPLEDDLLDRLIELALLAPSVGNSQPWRFVKVEDPHRRLLVRRSFETCNREALLAYDGERAAAYARLKLSGLDRAPAQLAVFVDGATAFGRGLGRRTMPETLTWSVVCAVHALWLAARAHGVGSAGCRSSSRRAFARSCRYQRPGRWSRAFVSAGRRRNTSTRNWIAPAGSGASSTSSAWLCDDRDPPRCRCSR